MLPEGFVRRTREVHGAAGEQWLERFPELLAKCGSHWGLRLEPPFPGLSYHYAAPASRKDGAEVVLKVGVPSPELLSEMRALRRLEGRGTVRVLDCREEWGALLLERLRPGECLGAATPEAARTAAGLMRRVRVPVPNGSQFRSVGDWVSGMCDPAPRVVTGTSFPRGWIDRAATEFGRIEQSAREPVLLHGDLHQGNILSHGDDWRAIDPWGIIGEPAWEVGPFLLNAVTYGQSLTKRRAVLDPLIELFAEDLSLDAGRIRRCGMVRAVLSAFWSLEDHGAGWEPALATAEALT